MRRQVNASDIHDVGYYGLANAIIIKAIKDYRSAIKRVKKNKNDSRAISRINEVRRFFRSQYFQSLCDYDGEYIIEKVEKEMGYKGDTK